MVLMANGRSGKALKKSPDVEKDGNFIKNTKNWGGGGGAEAVLVYYNISYGKLQRCEAQLTMTMPEVHWRQNPNIKQYADVDWYIWSWPALLQPIVFFFQNISLHTCASGAILQFSTQNLNVIRAF